MSSRLLAGTRKGLFVFDVHGKSASQPATHFLGELVTAVLPLDERAWYVAVGHGHFGAKLHYTDDDGTHFREIAVPAYPPKPEGVDDRDPVRNQPVPWAVQQIWTIEAGGRANEVWCGTIPGGLFHSLDGGASWTLVEALWHHPTRPKWFGGGYDHPGIHSICVDPRDADCVTLAVSCGGIWRTRDGGGTWQSRTRGLRAAYMPPELADDPAIQDPHRMVQCPTAPDHFWVQHHNGIFHSINDAEDWQEHQGTPSSFGFAVACHPREAGVAWFVPAEKDQCRVPAAGCFGVMRTTDGGKTFELFTEGLPAAPAYHLVYRHGLDVDRTGEALAMGSTTGSLWIGRDHGERWTRVSAELPPIGVLRFCP